MAQQKNQDDFLIDRSRKIYNLTPEQLEARLEHDEIMTMADAADLACTTRSTIWRYYDDGTLPVLKNHTNQLRVFKSDVLSIWAVNSKKPGVTSES